MRAMILAAGKGKRLRPLTATRPKPLVHLAGKPLIDYALSSLSRAGVTNCIINLNYLGEQISNYVGSGEKWGMRIVYSREYLDLQTGGGVLKALPLLGGRQPFLLMNADLLHNFSLRRLILQAARAGPLAHLVLTPAAYGKGDFSLRHNLVVIGGDYTFCGISIIHPMLFLNARRRSFPLKDLLVRAVHQGRVSGEVHRGLFIDLGTPAQLASAESQVMKEEGVGAGK